MPRRRHVVTGAVSGAAAPTNLAARRWRCRRPNLKALVADPSSSTETRQVASTTRLPVATTSVATARRRFTLRPTHGLQASAPPATAFPSRHRRGNQLHATLRQVCSDQELLQ